MTTAAEARPRLRRGVRLSFDRVRGEHVLLYPEGMLFPNQTAVAVLSRCDGATTLAEIVTDLGHEYQGVRLEQVADLLARLVERWLVEVEH